MKSLLGWDGGFIMVKWDQFEEAVKWYQRHMGWTFIDQFITPVGKKAFFRLPIKTCHAQVTLKSFESDFEHFQELQAPEGNVRLTFDVADLEHTLSYFRKNNIEVSSIDELPDGTKTFDIYAFGGARLTAVHNSQLDGIYPNARLIDFGTAVCTRIGVKNLDDSLEWYNNQLGFQLAERYSESKSALIHAPGSSWGWGEEENIIPIPILLETLSDDAFSDKSNPSARVYFDVRPKEKFVKLHEDLKRAGIETSEIAGNPDSWAGFHFFDLDGNRLNVWTYQM
ncbi:VOC family protein [Pseudalkalibacillus caeni]|uniref:VOC family protein n=2 Tax=Exobacillus caeni TaxID=2574798 RepID=A0A5R9F2M1_9BACL|nr:VOC family protein [Pseudalkalibacillus caeni]